MTSRAAVLTPPASAGIAVIRIVGPQAISVLQRTFEPSDGTGYARRSERLAVGVIRDTPGTGEIIDQVVVSTDASAETVDINCHGGWRIVQRLLMLLRDFGIDIITWQELLGADCIAEEVCRWLPAALTRTAVQAVAAQHPGGLTAWARRTIDMTERNDLSVEDFRHACAELLDTHRLATRLLNPSVVVLSGAVNTGKSTLANALVGREQSIVAELAGTTRDWTGRLLDINGAPIELIDTAGIRPSTDPLEQTAQRQADAKAAQAELVLQVVAADDAEALAAGTASVRDGRLLVANKSDLVTQGEPQLTQWLYVSAKTGDNLDALRGAIADRLGFAQFDVTGPLVFTARQRGLLDTALRADDAQAVSAILHRLIDDRPRQS